MRKAQSLIEYALILVLISLVAVTALNVMGKKMSLKNSNKKMTTEQNVKATMTDYCHQKGLVYNETTEQCERAQRIKK